MKLKLYIFQHPDLPDEYVPVISSLPVKQIRKRSSGWDHGGMDFKNFCECMEKGEAIEIKKIKKYPKLVDIIPYNTDEELRGVEFENYDLNYLTIQDYFDLLYKKDLPESD